MGIFMYSWILLPLLTAGEVPHPCVLPFIYNRKSYSSCTGDASENKKLWCATTVNYNRNPQWKYCALTEYGGNTGGEPCVFPFAYKSRTFYSCTNEDADIGRFWCATTGSYDKDKKWSYCADTRLHAHKAGSCVFPFIYKGKNYSSCTTDGASTGKLWCSLTRNYDVSPKWAYCDPSEPRPCHFPFIYKGKSYSACTKDGAGDGLLWCATTANYDTDSKWKACSHQEYEGNSKGRACVFPFVYKNRTFYTCTNENTADGRFWCATTGSYDKDKMWSFCADTIHNIARQAVNILNQNSQYSSRNGNALSGTTLKWVWFQGSAPSGAVSIWNSYAKRTEYPCYEGCTPGFYSPNRGPYCLYPYGDKEYKSSPFWILVNEQNFESLKWQKDSWGDVPSNSINSCPGSHLYIGKNKYGLGKVDPHNKAFFIGINGKEYWYKYYDVLVIYKDYLSQRIYNVHYIKESGTYTNLALTLVSTRVTNKNCNTVKKITSLSKTITNERSWDFSTSISIGVSTSMTVGIFSIVGMEWSITAEKTFSWSETSTIVETVTFSETVEIDVPPNHTCDVTMEGQRMNGNIPFTATATREYHNGERRSATIQGVSKNTVVAHVDTYVKRCQPIPNAIPCN